MAEESLEEINRISQIIYDKKGKNILALDVRGVSTLTDFFVIAEGNVERHVTSLCREIVEKMKEEERSPLSVEGVADGDWVVIDYGDIVIHLFGPDLREHYELEKLWNEGKIVDLSIAVEQRECS